MVTPCALNRRRELARKRYQLDREAQSRRVYLAALRAGRTRRPRESTLARHGIAFARPTESENLSDPNEYATVD